MKTTDDTGMGGQDRMFQTTHWTQILHVQGKDIPLRDRALAGLLTRYWKPVYCYLRRKGHDNEAAKDLTQGFFCDVVLDRGLVERAQRAKGRFRTFLLTALEHYVASVHRSACAAKRTPTGGPVQLDGIESAELPVPARDATPSHRSQSHRVRSSFFIFGVIGSELAGLWSTRRRAFAA